MTLPGGGGTMQEKLDAAMTAPAANSQIIFLCLAIGSLLPKFIYWTLGKPENVTGRCMMLQNTIR
jgi:hypothetical protein